MDAAPYFGTSSDAAPAPSRARGWQAELQLHFARRGAKTVIADRRQRGPLLVQRAFYPEGADVCHTYLLHPPASIVGGDRLDIGLTVDAGAHAVVTTPAATRWHFSRGRRATVRQKLDVRTGGRLEWLPQENLFFAGTHARTTTAVSLHGDASFCGGEILGLGRPACAEHFDSGDLDARFELFRDGVPLLLERFRAADGAVVGMRGHTAAMTFVATGASPEVLSKTRDALAAVADAVCGATMLGDVLVARGIAAHCEPLRHAYVATWNAVRPLLYGRSAEIPRIWRT